MSEDMIGQMYRPVDTTCRYASSIENTRHSGYDNREETESKQRKRTMDHNKADENTRAKDGLLSNMKPKDTEIERLYRIIAEQRQETEKRCLEIERMRKINQSLELQRKETERRSQQITSEMARLTAAGGNFENVNDELSNSRVIERFQKLYSNDWVHLLKWLMKTVPDLSELHAIQRLSEVMKYGYQEGQIMADSQIRNFLLLDQTETVPTNEQHLDLFSLRREYAQTESVRQKIVKVVLQNILLVGNLSDFFEGERREDAKQKLQDFFNNYLDCCWLMVVSKPAIKLNFEVTGHAYRNCMEQFSKYSLKSPVEDRTKIEDTICEVVWPSVCLQNGSAFYQKGDVVVVTKGKIQDNSDCDFCTFDKYQKGGKSTTPRLREGRSKKVSLSKKIRSAEKRKSTLQSHV